MNWPRVSIFILLCLLVATSALAQVEVNGIVSRDEAGVKGATVKVYQNSSLVKSFISQKRGKYAIQVPFEKQYVIQFSDNRCLPIRIKLDTRVPEELRNSETLVDIPLNIGLYFYYQGMKEYLFDDPIGTIRYVGKGDQIFEFIPNGIGKQKLEEFRKRGKEIAAKGNGPAELPERREWGGVSQDSGDEQSAEPSKTKVPVTIKSPTRTLEVKKAEPAQGAKDSEINDSVKLLSPNAQKVAANLERSEKLSNEHSREQAAEAKGRSQKIGVVNSQADLQRKSIRNNTLEAAVEEGHELVQNRVAKQEMMARRMTTRISSDSTRVAQKVGPVLLSTTARDSSMVRIETIQYLLNGKKHALQKERWNWLLISYDYYYHDKQEITKEKFDEIKSTLK